MNYLALLLATLIAAPAFAESICITDPPDPSDTWGIKNCADILKTSQMEREWKARNQDVWNMKAPRSTSPTWEEQQRFNRAMNLLEETGGLGMMTPAPVQSYYNYGNGIILGPQGPIYVYPY